MKYSEPVWQLIRRLRNTVQELAINVDPFLMFARFVSSSDLSLSESLLSDHWHRRVGRYLNTVTFHYGSHAVCFLDQGNHGGKGIMLNWS